MIPYELMGYEPIHELWQYLYVFIIGWSAMVSLGGLLFGLHDHRRVNVRWTGTFVVFAAILSMHPYSLFTALWLNVLLFENAPLAAALIAAGYTLFGIWAFIYCLLGDRFWKRLHEKL